MNSKWDPEEGGTLPSRTGPRTSSKPSIDFCVEHVEFVSTVVDLKRLMDDLKHAVQLMVSVQTELRDRLGNVGVNGERGAGLSQVLADLVHQLQLVTQLQKKSSSISPPKSPPVPSLVQLMWPIALVASTLLVCTTVLLTRFL